MARASLSRTRVKMCGTTRAEDALAAVDYGVDALGFIFYAKSPRFIPPEKAAQIIKKLPPLIDRVGVFVNAPIKEVITAAGVGLSYLQLHGDESVDYCKEIRQRLPYCGIVKAFRVGKESRSEDFVAYDDCVDAFLLDTYVSGASGGTGKVFDWSIVEQLKLQRPIFLAGGLAPENVVQAITEVEPYAVDINSGVELRPGVKDHSRLKELLHLVQKTACQ
ncbi:MAG: phosphoribosylanthranilate isomerase [Desulfobulbaceae bacterium]|nr:phosphoribosylanthranilate isomerase [Desulfobulbaceae bacterium]